MEEKKREEEEKKRICLLDCLCAAHSFPSLLLDFNNPVNWTREEEVTMQWNDETQASNHLCEKEKRKRTILIVKRVKVPKYM